jgi:hypothetical protein
VELIPHADLLLFASDHLAYERMRLLSSGFDALKFLLPVLLFLQDVSDQSFNVGL